MSQTASSRANFQTDISRIDKYAPAELIGREAELKILSDAWQQAVSGEPKRPHILTFVALGGEGKTSLIAKWAADLAYQDWPGCDAAFAWSFYSQGTSEKRQASSDSFLKEALLFFGDVEIANSAASSFDKGRRLAQLVGGRRTLLILDGVEPLQYAPTSPTGSELKDQGVAALLKALASRNDGLCIITTRYSIPDLRNFWQTTAPEIKLKSLLLEAGVALLRRLGVKGRQAEFAQLVGDVRGHALTLNLLGSYLRDAHGGDIRKRDLINLKDADAEEQSGHAFHVMDAYVESFKREGDTGTRALSVLRLLGLFDRPATADCLNALWIGEEIGGLTGPLVGISEAQRNITLKRLNEAGLITVNRNEAAELVSLDAHPLLREYFAARMRDELPGGWLAAHRRLYEYLRDSTKEGDQPTLEDLQPLYQAVAHGCQGGLQREACDVYARRILQGDHFYSSKSLGALGSNLGAVAAFFKEPWTRISPGVAHRQGWLFNEAGYYLTALGRLLEALEPISAGLEYFVRQEKWIEASIAAGNMVELELGVGQITNALAAGKRILKFIKDNPEWGIHQLYRASYAHALHHAGIHHEALIQYQETEKIQSTNLNQGKFLYSQQGFFYCELLLKEPERGAWLCMLEADSPSRDANESAYFKSCDIVRGRTLETLRIAIKNNWLVDIALDHLSRGRAELFSTVIESKNQVASDRLNMAHSHLRDAVNGLRRSGDQLKLCDGLLSHAWLVFLKADSDRALAALDEAWEIAARGPMKLHMADIHLYRARLFHAVKPYPWNKFDDGREGRGPKDDLDAAEELINKCGYHRRDEELADAREAAKGWT